MKPNIVVGEVDPADFLEESKGRVPDDLATLWQWIDPEPTRTQQSQVYRGLWQYHHSHKRTWPSAIYAHPKTLIGVNPDVVAPVPLIKDNRLPEGIIFFAHPKEDAGE